VCALCMRVCVFVLVCVCASGCRLKILDLLIAQSWYASVPGLSRNRAHQLQLHAHTLSLSLSPSLSHTHTYITHTYLLTQDLLIAQSLYEVGWAISRSCTTSSKYASTYTHSLSLSLSHLSTYTYISTQIWPLNSTIIVCKCAGLSQDRARQPPTTHKHTHTHTLCLSLIYPYTHTYPRTQDPLIAQSWYASVPGYLKIVHDNHQLPQKEWTFQEPTEADLRASCAPYCLKVCVCMSVRVFVCVCVCVCTHICVYIYI